MSKLASVFVSYLLVPFLIYMYWYTDVPAYMYVLGTLCTGFFLIMVLVTIIMWVRKPRLSVSDQLLLRERIRSRQVSAFLHLVLGIAVTLAIFVYVNSYIGFVYGGSLLLLQVLRHRVKRSAFGMN